VATAPIAADRIAEAVTAAHARHKKNRRGKNASYIPALAEVDPQLFGVCVATVDGQTFSAGDARCQFALESISKVFTAALAIEQVGPREFHRKVGADPTGEAFNSVLALELHNDKPNSPMVNAGAMTATSLVSATDAEDRGRQILQIQSDFAGRLITVSEQIASSERATNFHNRAIAWLLLCGGYMYSDPMEACDVYTLQCSTLVTAVDLATMGATLANGGINPVTGKRVIAQANVSHLLALMAMEGLYTARVTGPTPSGCPPRVASEAVWLRCRQANWRSPPTHRRWTRPATAFARRQRSPRSRTPSGWDFSIRSAGTDPRVYGPFRNAQSLLTPSVSGR
jgi:glutaminase